ncbi:MAG TPA: hypothetical protein DIT55_01660 [Spirochaetaceae bacterium]|nr:hypothetical protein [Spirochaetaceae bacterium]
MPEVGLSGTKLQIRNSASEFLIFTRQAGENGIEVRVSVCRDFRHTAEDGKEYTSLFYNLDAIQFSPWASGVLRNFALRGYVLDKKLLKNGAFLSKEYFDDVLESYGGGA